MKTTYVMIDYENVQPKDLSVLKGKPVKVFLFVGSNQTKIPFDVASSLQALGSNAEYIKISGNGSNALDFHIAYYVGQLAERDPGCSFHIISKDTGFEPLIAHLKSNGIRASRKKDLSGISFPGAAAASSKDDRIQKVVENLAKRGNGRPRKRKTLANTINTICSGKLGEDEVEELIEELTKLKSIVIEADNVTYRPPISQS